jgi:hypothetical protein
LDMIPTRGQVAKSNHYFSESFCADMHVNLDAWRQDAGWGRIPRGSGRRLRVVTRSLGFFDVQHRLARIQVP